LRDLETVLSGMAFVIHFCRNDIALGVPLIICYRSC